MRFWISYRSDFDLLVREALMSGDARLLGFLVSGLQMLEYRTEAVCGEDCVEAILVEELTGRVFPRIPFQLLRCLNCRDRMRLGVRLVNLVDSCAIRLANLEHGSIQNEEVRRGSNKLND